MKKFTKVCLVISSMMFLLGIGCIIAGLSMAGNPITAAADIIENVSELISGYEEDFDADYKQEDFQLAGEFTKDEIKNLDVDMQVGQVVVKTVSGDACRVWIDNQGTESFYAVKVYEENETLHIEDGSDVDIDIEISVSSIADVIDMLRDEQLKDIGGKVIIEVPQQCLETVEANIQMGAMKFYDLTMTQMNINVEAGSVYGTGVITGDSVSVYAGLGAVLLDQIQCNTAIFDVEMGDITVNDIVTNQLTASVEMGSLILNKVDAKDTQADCEMGDITIAFAGNPQEYDISSSVEMGDVDIADNGGHNSNGIYKAQLDCEMGDIDVTFLKEAE